MSRNNSPPDNIRKDPSDPANRRQQQAADSSDLLFMEALLQENIEQYPEYVWFWDECKPVNDYYQ